MIMRKILPVVMLSITVALAAQQTDIDLFREAESRFLAGDFEFALDRYRALVAEHPVSQFIPDAQFRIGVALYRTGRPRDALLQLDRVGRRFRSTRYLSLVPLWQGVIHYNIGEYATAIERLQLFLRDEPADREARTEGLLYLALSHIALDDPDSAVGSLEQLVWLQERPWSRPYPFTLLLSLYARDERGTDIVAITDGLDVSTLDAEWRPRVRLFQAEGYLALDRIDDAVGLYRDVERASAEVATLAFQRMFVLAEQRLIPDVPDAVLGRAERALAGRVDVLREFWLRIGVRSYDEARYERAEIYLRRVWDLRSSETIPQAVALYLARILESRGEIDAARSIVDEYLRLYGDTEPGTAELLLVLGNLDLQAGRIDPAITSLRAAHARATRLPEDERALSTQAAYQLAFALRRQGATGEALDIVERVFATGRAAALQADLTRLRSRLLRESGRDTDALIAMTEYVRLRPADAAGAIEYINLLYTLGRYDRVIDEVPEVLSELGRQGTLNDASRGRLSYVYGLSLLNRARYAEAERELARITTDISWDDAALAEVVPAAVYYSAWAAYRAGEYARSAVRFREVFERFPTHELSPRAAYLAGWSHFRLGDFSAAQVALGRVGPLGATDDLQVEARFLSGRSLAAMNQLEQAASVFRSVYQNSPDSEFADDAWFEYAEVRSRIGNIDRAADAFMSLVARYPDSPLAEPALLRRGEILFGADRFGGARDAFFEYRTRFPGGTQMDAALYWGARASRALGEDAGALLLFERLIAEHRQSVYRADAMRGAAEIHEARAEYRQALNLLTEFQSAYPDQARSAGIQVRIDELVLLIRGLDQREARLLVTIESERGAATEAGRDAILELARLVIYQDVATQTTAITLLPRLEDVAEQHGQDPRAASQALFLMAEFAAQRDEFLLAASRYLEAATVGAGDRDLAARSIYRAAVMYSTVGRTAEVDQLLVRLRDQFPGSEWLEEARTLGRGDSR
ncbi:MAG: hypothetical protein EA382_03120 [Spirochaetaceae bacterium]|nr:MAG: hypothetical protein EA382_03120 [Spirochaetaceae bacterium]